MEVVDPGCGAGENGAQTTIEGGISPIETRKNLSQKPGRSNDQLEDCTSIVTAAMEWWNREREKEEEEAKEEEGQRSRFFTPQGRDYQ